MAAEKVRCRPVAPAACGEQKGTFYFLWLLGLPRGRRLACRPSRLAAIFVQFSEPYGAPGATGFALALPAKLLPPICLIPAFLSRERLTL